MHLRGFINEAQAQCYAIQEDAWTVMRFGGTAAEGAAAAAYVLALQQLLPSEYQSSQCRGRRQPRPVAGHPGVPDGDAVRAATGVAGRFGCVEIG